MNLIPSSTRFWTCWLPWQPHKMCVVFSAPGSSRGSLWTQGLEFNLETGKLVTHRKAQVNRGPLSHSDPGSSWLGREWGGGPRWSHGWPLSTAKIVQCPGQGGLLRLTG